MALLELKNSLNTQYIIDLSKSLNWSEKLTSTIILDLPKILNSEPAVNLLQTFKNKIQEKDISALDQIHTFNKNNSSTPDTFQIFCILAALPIVQKKYEYNKIPLNYFFNILNDIQIWVNDFLKKNQRIGFDKINWVSNHLLLNIFQIGAFQYEPKTFNKPFRVYLNKKNQVLLCIAENEVICDQQGLIIDLYDKSKNHFMTKFNENGLLFSGHVVSKKGYVQREMKDYLKSEWELIAHPNGNYIAFHIPEGSKLTIENLNASFLEANTFFSQYLPEFQYQIFATDSWIFDDQIADYLPESNLAKFQRCVHLLPIKNGDDEQFKERVFGDPHVNLNLYIPITQLQRIGLQHIRDGKVWRKKGFVLYKNDLPLNQKLNLKYKEN